MRKVELTMKEQHKYEMIKRVAEGKMKKQTAEIKLGVSRRQINRLVRQYQNKGKEAFIHGNRNKSTPRGILPEIKAIVLSLYQEKYQGANFSHFTQLLDEEEGIELSRSTVANILTKADILSPKAHRKTKREHKEKMRRKSREKVENKVTAQQETKQLKQDESHPSRPRKKYFGEQIQMDASEHVWFGTKKSQLHIAIDDSTGTIVGAYFDTQETLYGYYRVYQEILKNYGIPFEFLTDRRTVFEYERKQKKKLEADTFTQFSYACHQLGTKLSTTSVPQAKGRVERLFGTLQSRLTIELSVNHITTIEKANVFLNSYIKKYNAQFASTIDYNRSVFEKAPTASKLNVILGVLSTRKINAGHHFRYENEAYLPTASTGKEVYYPRGTEVLVIRGLNQSLYVTIEEQIYPVRKLAAHELVSEEFDRQEEPTKKKRQAIPPMSHPWKAESFRRYLAKQGLTQEMFDAQLHSA